MVDDVNLHAKREQHAAFHVNVRPERAWEVMSDTQHLNQLIYGFGRQQLLERRPGRLLLRGSFGLGSMDFEEFPFVFEAPRHYVSRREFVSGPVRSIEFDCTIVPSETGSTVSIVNTVKAKTGAIGSVALVVADRQFRKSMKRLREFLDGVRDNVSVTWPIGNPDPEVTRQRADPFLRVARRDAPDDLASVLEKVVDYVCDAADYDVARMRPFALADLWGVDRERVLSACLYATQAGVLRLSWDLLCPNCEQSPTIVEHLQDVPGATHCDMCEIDFGAQFDRNVEATFRPAPNVRETERTVFCHGSPARMRNWLAQFSVEAGATVEFSLRVTPGRFQLQLVGSGKHYLFDVVASAEKNPPSDVDVNVIGGEGIPFRSSTSEVAEGEVRFKFTNPTLDSHRVQIAERRFADDAVTAADIMRLPLFRNLFSGEVLAPGQHIDVARVAILFTDLVGSTSMYETFGDAASYAIVRDHFNELFNAVEINDGIVVKTVGDCVMASFPTALHAVKAGEQCIHRLAEMLAVRGTNAPNLALRIGVHIGPCIAVSTDGTHDFFGRTVNIAARVEGLADRNEIVVTHDVADEPGVAAWLDAHRSAGHSVSIDRKAVKGVEGALDIHRIDLDR